MLVADAPRSFHGVDEGPDHSNAMVLTEHNFTRVSYWLNQLSGRDLKEYEKLTVHSRLSHCAMSASCQNVNQYVDLLVERSSDFTHSDWTMFTDCLMASDNWFRREARLFQFLKQIVFPEMSSDVRILSAGCGTGEEAYDLAFECAEAYGFYGGWQVDGIDLSGDALVQARQGVFAIEHCRLLPEKFIRHYFSEEHNELKINTGIKEKVKFSHQNLLDLESDYSCDVIFCRNVMMDMDKISAKRLVEKLSSALADGGYLIVSHNESLEPYFSREQCLTPYIAKIV